MTLSPPPATSPGAREQMCEFILRRKSLLDMKSGKDLLTIVMSELEEGERCAALFKARGIEHIDLELLPDQVLATVHGFMGALERSMQSACH